MTVTAAYTELEHRIAQVVHEAARALQYEQGDPCPSPPWQCAPPELRETALDGVRRALAGETAEQHHEAWRQRKARLGWVHGPVKDYAQRTHPCMVPWDKLPREQQVKDRVFLAVVRAMAG